MARPCFGCETFDDGPRHEVVDPSSGATHGSMHLDCCAELNGCVICRMQLERAHMHAGEHVKDEALGAVLEALPPLQVEHVSGTAHGEVDARG